MERLIQLLDEVDDLCAVLRHRLGWWPGARRRRRAVARALVPAPQPSP